MNRTPDLSMSRLVRIETKLSVFMQEAQKRFDQLDARLIVLQQDVNGLYIEEEEECQNQSST